MKAVIASLTICVAFAPALAGPDFVTPTPRTHALAASPASSEIDPTDDIVFATDAFALTDAAIAQIDTAARWLKRHGRHRIVVEGYADAIGDDAYNEALATRRAAAVRRRLATSGVDPDRVVIVVYGERAARGGDNPLDRRVVMYATRLAPQQIAAASLDRNAARSVTWTDDRTLFTERRRTVIGTR